MADTANIAVRAFANLTGRGKAKASEDAMDDDEKEEDAKGEKASKESKAEEDQSEDEKEAKAEEDGETDEDEEEGGAKATSDYDRGASFERKRIASILSCSEANGKGASALHLALNTDLSAKDAKGTLAGLSQEANQNPSKLDKAMRTLGNAEIGAEGGKPDAAANNHGWGNAHARVSGLHKSEK